MIFTCGHDSHLYIKNDNALKYFRLLIFILGISEYCEIRRIQFLIYNQRRNDMQAKIIC